MNCVLHFLVREADDDEHIYIDIDGRNINKRDEEKLQIKCDREEHYKDHLLANLYSTVEFLRKELEEKNMVIRNLIQQ